MARIRSRRVALRRGSALIGASIALGGWALVYPVPYAFCVTLLGLAILTALALPWLSAGRFVLEEKHGQLSAVGQTPIALSMILAIRALVDVDMIDWKGPLLLAGGCGLLFALLGLGATRQGFRTLGRKAIAGIAVSFFLGGVAFGWGASVEANILLDGSAPTTHRLRVVDKWVVHGRTTRPHLRLAAPNDLGVDDVHVSGWLYARTPVGEFVCVRRRSGALGFRWYWVETCPTSGV